MARHDRPGALGPCCLVSCFEAWTLTYSELGIATHYVDPSNIPALVEQLQQLENPTLESVSAIVSTYHVSRPEGTDFSSKASREGPTPITGGIRRLLDKTFNLGSIQEIYMALEKAENDSDLAPEVSAWAAVQRKMMDERSPTGMAVALANFKLAKAAQRLNTSLENDILMATGFVGNDRPTEDFAIGVTHVLIDKSKGRANWNPSSLNDEFVTPKSIKANFFNRSAKHMAEVPKLEFVPTPTTKEGPDSTWGKFRAFGLPSEAEVKGWIQGEKIGSGAFKLKEAELVERIIEARQEPSGPRHKEITDRVMEICDQYTRKDDQGYLDWMTKGTK